jgi:hypothetical protein
MSNNDMVAPLFFGCKVISLLSSYIALRISENYMTQIYMEKVYINGNNPPNLINLMFIWLIIYGVFNLFILMILFVTSMDSVKLISQTVFIAYLQDVIATSVIVSLLAWGITSVVQNKKYFLYMEDMRGIRAAKSLMIYSILICTVIPFGLLTFDSKKF